MAQRQQLDKYIEAVRRQDQKKLADEPNQRLRRPLDLELHRFDRDPLDLAIIKIWRDKRRQQNEAEKAQDQQRDHEVSDLIDNVVEDANKLLEQLQNIQDKLQHEDREAAIQQQRRKEKRDRLQQIKGKFVEAFQGGQGGVGGEPSSSRRYKVGDVPSLLKRDGVSGRRGLQPRDGIGDGQFFQQSDGVASRQLRDKDGDVPSSSRRNIVGGQTNLQPSDGIVGGQLLQSSDGHAGRQLRGKDDGGPRLQPKDGDGGWPNLFGWGAGFVVNLVKGFVP